MNNLTPKQIKNIFLGMYCKGIHASAGIVLQPSGLRCFKGKEHRAVEQNPNTHSTWAKLAREKKAKIAWIFENDGGYVGILLAYKVDGQIKLTMQDLDNSRAEAPTDIYQGTSPTIEELEAYNVID